MFHKHPAEVIAAKADAEKKAMHKQRKRLAKRAKIGADWDGKVDNDNIAWPLAKALLAEGNSELLKYAMAYRRIYDQAKSEAQLGLKGSPSPDMVVVHRSRMDESTGKIVYGGELVRKAGTVDIPATRAVPTNPDSKKNAAPVPRPWTGDRHVNDMLDAKEKLAWLQMRLGHLCEPFEMACIDGATLQQVGNAVGQTNNTALVGGREMPPVANG